MDAPAPKPPWEAELEQAVLAEERARRQADQALEQAEAAELRRIKQRQLVEEFEALLSARKEELEGLRKVRTDSSRLILGPQVSREAELLTVAQAEVRHRSPYVVLGIAAAVCLILWALSMLAARELAALDRNYEQGAAETLGVPEREQTQQPER